MTTPSNPLDSELELDRLLDELLENGNGAPDAGAAAPELLELRDTARRLRASVQWVPLPTGRSAVRRALLATIDQTATDHGRALRRRTTQWLAAAGAVAAMGGVFALGASALDIFGAPSRPLYGVRLGVDAARVAVAISLHTKADVLVEVTRARLAEVTTAAAADNVIGVQRAAAALAEDAGRLRTLSKALPDPGQRIAGIAARAENVAVAAQEAAQLRSRDQLPAGVSMADLVVRAAGARPGTAPGGPGQPGGGPAPSGGSGNAASGSDPQGRGSAPGGNSGSGSRRSGADKGPGNAQPGAGQSGTGSQGGSAPNGGPNAGGGSSSGGGQHSGGQGSGGDKGSGGSPGSGSGKSGGNDSSGQGGSTGHGGSGSGKGGNDSGGQSGNGDKGNGGGQGGSGGGGDKGSGSGGGQGGSSGGGDKGSGSGGGQGGSSGGGDKGSGSGGGQGGSSGGGDKGNGSGGSQGGSGSHGGGGGKGGKK